MSTEFSSHFPYLLTSYSTMSAEYTESVNNRMQEGMTMMRNGVFLLIPLLLILDCNCAPAVNRVRKAALEAAEARETAEIRKVAEQGDAEAQFKLGICYANGTGVPEDLAQAVVWFRKAAEQGNVDAQTELGLIYVDCESIYADCEGVPKDIPQAAIWFGKAAEQGDGLAMVGLGVIYGKGDGMPKDLVAAYQWYDLATAHGRESAGERRDEIAKQMTPEQLSEAQSKTSPNGPQKSMTP